LIRLIQKSSGIPRVDSEYSNNAPGNGKLTVEQEELRRLRAENKQLRLEREVLKKPAAFFAKESS